MPQLTRQQFADTIGVSTRTVARWQTEGMPGCRLIGTPGRSEYRIDSTLAKRWLTKRAKGSA